MKRLKIARDKYLQELGIEFKNQNSRERNYVLVRSAFMCASRGLFTAEVIGNTWGRDHSTVCYATNQHQVNLKFSDEYGYYYEVAKKHLKKLPKLTNRKLSLKDPNVLTEENRLLEARVRFLELENAHYKNLIEYYHNRYVEKD